MSIIAEKIEDGYLKRWLKNSFRFIFDNPLVIFYYLSTVSAWGYIVYISPLHNAMNIVLMLSAIYFTFLMYSIQYETSYRKLNLFSYIKLIKTSFTDGISYIVKSRDLVIFKIFFILSIIGFFDYTRSSRTYPIKVGEEQFYYNDFITIALLTSCWTVIIIESFLCKTSSKLEVRIPFSCEYILKKFSNFSNEESVEIAINKLIEESAKINKKAYLITHFTIYFFLIIAIFFSSLHPLINLFLFAFIPIFYFQAGKETFLDQGNKKHQKQEEESKQTNEVPNPSGA